MNKNVASLAFIVLAGLLVVTAVRAEAREGCQVCGMYLDLDQRTCTLLVDKEGHEMRTCGIACMLRLISDAGGPAAFSRIRVKDFNTGRELDGETATYVIGSNVVPDMLPSILAFADRKSAEAFARKHGGEVIDFSQALLSISPTAMTMPVRIMSAVLPARGGTMAGIGYMVMTMDEVALGSDSIDPADFIRRPGQMMGPKEMTSNGEMFMANHSVTDSDNIAIKIPYFEKKMEMYTMGGMGVATTRNSGLGDMELSWRHAFWKNNFYSRFLTGLASLSLPTGDFDTDFITSPLMQLGRGAFAGTAGILYSQRMGNFWLHSSLTYNLGLENSDDYRYGNIASLGAALHYTPNYNLLFGLELDASNYAKDEYQGAKQDATGGFRSFATAVANWRFLTALGGSFSLKGSFSLPLYEDMNHYEIGGMEKAQMGGGYMGSISLSFARRFLY